MTAAVKDSSASAGVRRAGVEVVEVPDRFRLGDENPLTCRPYAASTVADLPPYVWEAIESAHGLTPAQWNALVRSGSVTEELDGRERLSLRGFLRSVRSRGPRNSGPPGWCPDCWGTWAVHDADRSVTGKRGGVYVCDCVLWSGR